MSQQLIALFTQAQVHVADALQRAREEERGQTFVEWMGVMVVIIAIVTIATQGNFMNAVATAIRDTAESIISGIA